MIKRQNRHGVAHRVDTARHEMPRPRMRRRVDWCEVGWRVGPYAAALICFLGLYFAGGPQ